MKSELKVFHHQIACKRIVNHFIVYFFKLLYQNTTNNRKQNTFFSQSHYSTIIQLAISILQPFQIRQFDLLVHYKCTMKKGPKHYAWYRFACSFSMSVKKYIQNSTVIGSVFMLQGFPKPWWVFPQVTEFYYQTGFQCNIRF